MKREKKEVRLFVGPQHPGVTGNMSIEIYVEGDEIKRAITHVGYLHRAFEKLMEMRPFIQIPPLVCRICVPEPDTNEENFARGIEELAGIEVPERAKWIRTLVLELSRLQMFLMWYGGMAGSMGLSTAPQLSIGDRDYVLDLFEELTGGRIYHIFIIPGGVRRDLPEGFEDKVEEVLNYIEKRMEMYDDLILGNGVFIKRVKEFPKIKREWVDEMGLTGPVARACGFPYDVRKNAPYEAYGEMDFEIITEEGCDFLSMIKVRRREIDLSIKLIREVLNRIPKGEFFSEIPNPLTWRIERGETYVKSEATRGEYGFYMVTDGSEKPRRIHVRGPSYIHAITLLERLLVGANISDVAPILVGLQICPPEIER